MCLHVHLYMDGMYECIEIDLFHLIPKISYFKNKNQLYLIALSLLGHASVNNRVCELSKRNQEVSMEEINIDLM